MKKRKGTKQLGAILLGASLFVFFGAVLPATNLQQAFASTSQTGNGAPSGAHYNLNLIGKKKTDQLPNDSDNGHRIFVNLQGNSKIYLQNGTDFAVIDADATDGSGMFQLPPPQNQYDGSGNYLGPGAYTVWARAEGKPGGNGTISTCATDLLTGEYMCATGAILFRTHGKQTFQDVTKQLTTAMACTSVDPITGACLTWKTVDIFDPSMEGYLWSYDNNGLKVVQLRFYPTA
jgi:hypothetical protein